MIKLEGDDSCVQPRIDRMKNAAAHGHTIVALKHRGRIGEQRRNSVPPRYSTLRQCRRQLARARIKRRVATAQRPMDDCCVIWKNHGCALKKCERCQRLKVCWSTVQICIVWVGTHISGILPAGLTLFDEGPDALFCVAGHHILNHHLRGVVVGLRERHFALRVKGALACRQCHA